MDYDEMTVAEIDEVSAALNAANEEHRANFKAEIAANHAARARAVMRERLAGMSDAERGALAQILGIPALPSGAAVGSTATR